MSFLFSKFGRGKNIPTNATFRLTQEGRDKLQEFGGDPKSRVLVALETRGSSDIDEIAQTSGLSRGQVERLIPVLVRGGYIQYLSASAIGEGGE
jgi:DNA-binding MarR family transcriptional regulator